MANWRYRRLLRQAWHPTDEELLLHVEGESDARAVRTLSDHLSACWTCRARRTEIERAIGAYMSYHLDPARAGGADGASGIDDTEQATRRFAIALARAKERPQHAHDATASFGAVSDPGAATDRGPAGERAESNGRESAMSPGNSEGWRQAKPLGWTHRWKRLRAKRERAEQAGESRLARALARGAAVVSEATQSERVVDSGKDDSPLLAGAGESAAAKTAVDQPKFSGGGHQWKRLRATRERAERAGERRLAWTLARGAALVVALVLVVRWWLAPTTVSARELMARVDRAQQQEIAAVADPVVYQRLHASRASTKDTVTWEVWASQRQRRIVERVSESSPLLLDLQEVLRENGMEPGQPLSAASLMAWRRLAGHVAEDVRETTLSDGAAAVTLTSSAPGPVAAGRIARSEVIVRTRDWHPVTHILTVAGAAAGQQQRYTITELNFRVVPLETVEATIFNPPAVTAPLTSDEPAADVAATPTEAAVDPASAAVRALYEEHTSGACLSDRAFAETQSIAGGSAGSSSAIAGGAGAGADTAMRHLWAIRQLAEWYRTAQNDGLDRKSRAMLAAMVREHLEAARHHLPSSSGAADQNAAAALETDDAAGGEPWTTLAMKAYAAVEYASRASAPEAESGAPAGAGSEAPPNAAAARQDANAPRDAGTRQDASAPRDAGTRQDASAPRDASTRQDASARQDAVARARVMLRSLDAAVQRFAPGTASAPAVPAAPVAPHASPAPLAPRAPGDAPRGVTPPQNRP